MIAKYRGTCEDCGAPYYVGSSIKRNSYGEWVHVTCPPDPLTLQPGEEVCDECFLVKPCACD